MVFLCTCNFIDVFLGRKALGCERDVCYRGYLRGAFEGVGNLAWYHFVCVFVYRCLYVRVCVCVCVSVSVCVSVYTVYVSVCQKGCFFHFYPVLGYTNGYINEYIYIYIYIYASALVLPVARLFLCGSDESSDESRDDRQESERV